MTATIYTPGQRLRITQQVPRLGNAGDATTLTMEGTVIGQAQSKTGSWYAHSKDHKLWLDRVEVRKDDGEIVFVNLDQFTSVEIV